MDERFTPQIEDAKKRAAGMAQGAADAVTNAASKASDTVTDMAGQVKRAASDSTAGRSAAAIADEAAKRFSGAADYVRDTEPQDMWDDFVSTVRARPVESLAAAVVIGFLAGRAARRM